MNEATSTAMNALIALGTTLPSDPASPELQPYADALWTLRLICLRQQQEIDTLRGQLQSREGG